MGRLGRPRPRHRFAHGAAVAPTVRMTKPKQTVPATAAWVVASIVIVTLCGVWVVGTLLR